MENKCQWSHHEEVLTANDLISATLKRSLGYRKGNPNAWYCTSYRISLKKKNSSPVASSKNAICVWWGISNMHIMCFNQFNSYLLTTVPPLSPIHLNFMFLFLNTLSALNASSMCTGVGPSAEAWVAYQRLHPAQNNKKLLSISKKPSIANSSVLCL